ncbi:MAG TPA: flagellar biosynthesis protein FlhF [Dehalococcoidia bacterium]
MKVKRYQAEDMAKAYAQIRADLGPDAIILSARTVRPAGVLGLMKRPMVEVTAAAAADVDGITAEISPKGRAALAKEAARPSPAPQDGATFAALLQQAAAAAAPAPAAPAEPAAEGEGPLLRELERSIEEMRQALERLTARSTVPERLGLPEPLAVYYQRLREQGVEERLLETVLTGVRQEVSPREFEDEDVMAEAIARRLALELPQPKRLHLATGRTQILFAIGPTGSGKTTTLVKLASHLMRSNLRVLLVCADTVRVGAVAQIQAYADLLGLDLRTAYNAADLRAAVQEDEGHDVLLVDTPGRNPNDGGQMEELRALLGAVRRKQVYLTLPAHMDAREMAALVERFEVAPLTGLIFTKLDEAAGFGGVINTLYGTQRPAAFFADGQDVLGNLEPASIRRLVRLAVLGPNEAEEHGGHTLARSA